MYKKILITGSSSKVGQELIKLIPTDHKVYAPKSKQFDMNNIELIRKKRKFIGLCADIVLINIGNLILFWIILNCVNSFSKT